MVMHVVLGDNENTKQLIKNLVGRDQGLVTVIDSKYKGLVMKEDVTYSNMDYIRSSEDLPISFIFYAYMEPKKQE